MKIRMTHAKSVKSFWERVGAAVLMGGGKGWAGGVDDRGLLEEKSFNQTLKRRFGS